MTTFRGQGSHVYNSQKLGPRFVATVCWWCEGTTLRGWEHCSVCGKGKPYGSALGLLIDNQPAPDLVVNQVLVAAGD